MEFGLWHGWIQDLRFYYQESAFPLPVSPTYSIYYFYFSVCYSHFQAGSPRRVIEMTVRVISYWFKNPHGKSVFSNRCGKCPERTMASPSLSHRLFVTCHWPWEGVSFLANPEVACTPGARGQSQLHLSHGLNYSIIIQGQGKLDRKMSTIDSVS